MVEDEQQLGRQPGLLRLCWRITPRLAAAATAPTWLLQSLGDYRPNAQGKQQEVPTLLSPLCAKCPTAVTTSSRTGTLRPCLVPLQR